MARSALSNIKILARFIYPLGMMTLKRANYERVSSL